MNFDPQKFLIGLLDFFSILLPSALLTWLLIGEVGPVVLGDRYTKLADAQAWTAFLLASYLFGHLVFLLASWLDEFYDWARRYMLNCSDRAVCLPRAPATSVCPRPDLAGIQARAQSRLGARRRDQAAGTWRWILPRRASEWEQKLARFNVVIHTD
jgi:hypothetical protein